jgi:amino acid transporter
MIGSGAFAVPSIILANTKSVLMALFCWLLASLVALIFGLCYAELGATYPGGGGDTIYLTKAYGKWAGYIFSLISMLVVLPGGGAVMSQTICSYLKVEGVSNLFIIAGILITLTSINILEGGLVFKLQYVFTFLKIAIVLVFTSLAAMVLCRMIGVDGLEQNTFQDPRGHLSNWGGIYGVTLGLYITLWSYDGWNTGNFIADKVRDHGLTLPLATMISVAVVSFLYILINLSYMYVLPYDTFTNTEDAPQMMRHYFNAVKIHPFLQNILPYLVIIIPSLGTLNSTIMVGASIIDSFLPNWKHRRLYRALLIVLYSLTILGYSILQNIDRNIRSIGFCAYLFYGASILGLILLRTRDVSASRPFKVHIALPIIALCFSCYIVGFSIYNTFILPSILK